MDYIILDNEITVKFENDVLNFQYETDSKLFDNIKNILLNEKNKEKKIKDLLNSKNNKNSKLKQLFSESYITYDDYNVYIDDEIVSYKMGCLIRKILDSELDCNQFVNFIRKVRENPNKKIIHQISDFIAYGMENGQQNFSLAKDGDIIAYKAVTSDYKDIYSKKFDNSIGNIVKIERNEVDDNRNKTCSTGLHFCSFSYLSCYGFKQSSDNRVMIVKVNPKNIVSIPIDYNFSKGRCYEYSVIGEIDYFDGPIKTIIYDEFDDKIYKEMKIHINLFVIKRHLLLYYKKIKTLEEAFNYVDLSIYTIKQLVNFHNRYIQENKLSSINTIKNWKKQKMSLLKKIIELYKG